MLRLSRTLTDKLLIAGCLLVIFVIFPLAMHFWSSNPKVTAAVGHAERTAAALPDPNADSNDNSFPALPFNAGPPPLPAGTKATDFASTTVDGKSYIFDSRAPHIKLVDFWATWCGPCRMSIPTLEHLSKSLKGSGVEVVGVSVDSSTADRVPQFAKAMGMNYTVLVDPKKNALAAATYNASGLPSLYIIDGKGIIRWSFSGYWQDEEPYLRRVIADIQTGKSVD
jgi:thiol-disulfide isomerase/thioredoxin